MRKNECYFRVQRTKISLKRCFSSKNLFECWPVLLPKLISASIKRFYKRKILQRKFNEIYNTNYFDSFPNPMFLHLSKHYYLLERITIFKTLDSLNYKEVVDRRLSDLSFWYVWSLYFASFDQTQSSMVNDKHTSDLSVSGFFFFFQNKINYLSNSWNNYL